MTHTPGRRGYARREPEPNDTMKDPYITSAARTLGGATSAAKAAAARENGRKGGRPKTRVAAAIRHARDVVSDLYRIGDGWTHNVYDEDRHATRQGALRPFAAAQHERSAALITAALAYLGHDEDAINERDYEYRNCHCPGRWTDWVSED